MATSIPPHSGARVLIVEDNDADYLLLLRQVERLLTPGFCSRVSNRAELTAALDQDWDLIVTDYHLFDIEEQELLEAISSIRSDTPCLVMSGSAHELQNIEMPANVFGTLEKGDHAGLREALTGNWTAGR